MGTHKVATTLTIVAIIVLLNLRGLKESGVAFAIPTYAFIVGIIGMVAVGVAPARHGRRPPGVHRPVPDQVGPDEPLAPAC